MTADEIRNLIITGLPAAEVTIGGDGYHVDVFVVSDAFDGLSRLKRQQLVYTALDSAIRSGALHAVNIHAQTVAEHRASGHG